jgi:hypothetical protein
MTTGVTIKSPQALTPQPGAPKKIEFHKIEPAELPTRMVLDVSGAQGSGKTDFALSAPGPIGIINLDFGLEGVVEKWARKKDIYAFDFAIPFSAALPGSPFTAIGSEALKVWEEVARTFRACLKECRTTILDTGSEAWSLLRLARLGKLTQIMPVMYTAVNAEFRQLSQLALQQTTCNVIYTHKIKAVYENEQKTEKMERAGFSDIGYDVQAEIRAERDLTKPLDEQFGLVVEKCRVNPKVSGRRFGGNNVSFQDVAAAIYPDVPPEVWQ